ncbi:MAG TPA: DoxX family protein [Sediminibacterium sp.]|nr:DoxX family protein [Sediminibacterium sp.]
MKSTKLVFWVITILFAAFMSFSAVPDMLVIPEAVSFMTHLGYPHYFIAFIGVAKLLGVIAILIPGHYRIKEWAYAGLCFDLVGAGYSIIATDGLMLQTCFMILPLAFLFASYYLYHKTWQRPERAQ